ncbi:glycerol kinase [Colletotrichum abscissum]|uniref:glycerol kinase n=6 Tax=Colletotrichum acutatum species complex TaxID=2707335 RepID=A0A9P9XLZ2_9PEZI|nr:glycerol kinase [Colletotrichum tamarilloi]KAI3534341.1 glycerol kinase [Colletotrichum filicis]KAI3556388.1 glycerol kinase [Colletotrichum abscissum]KAK0369714.1 glycerol kinase [Colletotrichum limetticola]KAK1481662.1 glycerol kinase [Colletotrichum tamarilloi]
MLSSLLPSRFKQTSDKMSPTSVNGGAGSKISFVGAIDQGTTSTRFLIFNPHGEVVATHQLEFKQIYPNPGWHEHDPEELVASVETCIDGAVQAFETQGHSREQIKAVGITNQRETTVLWDTTTGKALYNAIVWTDTRTKDLVRRLKQRLGASELTQRCGLPLSTYPSVGKLLWLLENSPEVKDAYERGVLAFGTIDTWLVYKLNGGTARDVYVSDPSNASRTMFMNIHTLKYDEDLIDWFRIDPKKVKLAKIVRSSDPEAYGTLHNTVLSGTKITGCLGDQSAALVGQKGFTAGLAKNTYGTGCFLLYNIGPKPVISSHGLLTTVAFDFGPGKTMYALEGSIAVAGSSVKFLVDNFGFMESSSKLSALAETVEDNGGCTFVTAFSGLFAPYWIDDARGTIFGITAYTQRGHIARATLEATCFQTKAILDSMEKDSGAALTELAVDGGMCNSDLVMQTQSDIIGIPVNRPGMRETTALGAAIAAGFAAGVWKSFDELKDVNLEGRTIFKPQISEEDASERFGRWEKAVQMSKGWSS